MQPQKPSGSSGKSKLSLKDIFWFIHILFVDLFSQYSFTLRCQECNFFSLQHENKSKQLFCSHVIAMFVCVGVSVCMQLFFLLLTFFYCCQLFFPVRSQSFPNQSQDPNILKSLVGGKNVKHKQHSFLYRVVLQTHAHLFLASGDYTYVTQESSNTLLDLTPLSLHTFRLLESSCTYFKNMIQKGFSDSA